MGTMCLTWKTFFLGLNRLVVILILLSSILCHTLAFSDSFYFEVKENSPPQTYVGKIATRSGFTYRFNDDPVEFNLDPQSGVISTGDVLVDRESKEHYNLVILSSSPTYPIEVKIRVLDVNDNVPFWPSSINTNISFSESAPVGTKVIIDNAIDPDSGQLKYNIDYVSDITSGIYSALPFKLNYNSSSSFLHLEVANDLDRELQGSYLVNITATDQDEQSSFAIFSIRVLDSNDNPPIFDHSDYSVSLNESMPKDVSILQVRATDADEDDNDNSRISYYLNSDDFKIDQNTGVIFTSHDGPIICGTTIEKSADECWRICVFTVFAHDYGVPRQDGRTYVTAKIYDSNNHAPVIKFRYFSKSDIANMDETATNGSIVAAVSVVDFDQGRNGLTSVELTGGNELGHFRLDPLGNSHIIRLVSTLDRKKVPEYNLTVTAYDHGTPRKSSSANLRIVVQDSNRFKPVFEKKLYETTITETQSQIGLFVYSLQATDMDEGINSQIYYGLSGINSHYFKIDSTSGLITTDKVINREEIDFFELNVTARDSGNYPRIAHTTLQVKVLDINDQVPVIELLSKYSFDKETDQYEVNLQEGLYLDLDLAVKDDDLGDNGTVDVHVLYDYHNLFHIEPESMKLLSNRQLHFEQCDSYKIVLLAKDRAPAEHQLSSLTTIRVNVESRHDVKPIFYPRQYFASIAVNSLNLSANIIKFKVNDADITSAVTFAIRTEDDLVNQLFTVNGNGEVRFANNGNDGFLQNAPSFISFEVECIDCRQGQNMARVTFFLVDSEPEFRTELKSQYHFRVEENSSIGTTVGQLEFDVGMYDVHLVEGDLSGHFRLTGNSIHTSKSLDREMVGTYKLKLIAIKSGYLYPTEVLVELIDVNDCQPQFEMPFDRVVLDRHVPPRYVVRRLDAFDADLNDKQKTEYSLVENPHDLFLIDGNELKLAKTISAAARHSKKPISAILRVKIRATDKEAQTSSMPEALNGYARCHLSNELTLFISINSSETSRARFMKKFYEFFISESTPINEQVFKLATRHIYDDSVNFAIVSGNSNNSFGILPSGYLYIRQRLDRESIDLYLLNVVMHETRLTSNGSIIELDNCQVLIRVLDVNDNKPTFDQQSYQFGVPENVPKNFLIGQVKATDRDTNDNARVTYSLVKSYYSSFVQIDHDYGYLWSSHEYDHESLDHFEILVLATDQPIDEARYSSQVTVRIDILDVNDNRPVFEIPSNVSLISLPTDDHQSGKLIISEATEVGIVLAHFRAVDVDSESSLTYRLNDLEKSFSFHLSALGALTLVKALDREKKDNYKLTIEGSDGQHISRFELLIVVEDVNDCLPEWINLTQTELFIPENISIGSEIMQFHAVDRDLGANALFYFTIESYTGSQKVFDILKQKLVVVNNLDYEKINVHLLNVSLIEKNSGKVSSTKTIQINLIDINDCKPVFVQRTDTEVVRVLENIDIGTILLTLQAIDCDQNDVLTYEIVSCNTHYHTHKNIYQKDHELQHKHDSNNCPLKLNTRNGEIININNLDREVIESINLQLSVRDSAGHFDKIKVIFIIDDINDESPMFVSPKKIIVSKEWLRRPNTVIGSVKAIDLDMGINSVITYKLQSTLYEQYLELDRFLGTFKVKKSLEHMTDHPLLMNVSAVDGGGLSSIDTVQFIVRPDLPHLGDENIEIDIYENEPIGTQITKLKCTNPDMQPSCQFHLVNATDRNFQVDTWTGIISTVDLIDREMLETRLLEVLVISKFNLQTIQVKVNILDENDNPPYLTNTSIVVHLKESVLEGTEVFDLSQLIADEDTNNKFDYQMINCSNCDGTFSLNRKTGILTLQSLLDSEKNNKYRILFGVSDGIYLLTSLMEVIVDDENDNQPYFNQSVYVFEIDENTERGVVVGKVVAFDDDVSNKNLYYSVLSETSNLDVLLSAFSLDSRTGEFTLSKRLDYETDPSQYEFLVQASDGVYKSLHVKVIFKLINLPDNPPIFETNVYKIEVIENSLLQDVICVSATDADLKTIELNSIDSGSDSLGQSSEKHLLALKYYIENSSATNDNFHINASNGCISIVKPLDREQLARIDFNVIADDGYFNATALVEVKVLDDNDNYPIFEKMTPPVLRIEENAPIDTVVYTFKAVDLDEPPNSYIKYEIVSNDSDRSKLPFVIGPIDGQLKVTANIDRELVDNFDVVIRANDYGLKYSEFHCRIEIDDVFDNSPVFSKAYYEVSLYENISVGEIALKLDTQDADPTDEVSYKIIAGNSLGHFRIDDESLVVASKLNYEMLSVYDLKIDAIDKGGNLDTANFKVNLLNVMDERPIFSDSPYLVNWFENQVGVVDRYEAYPEHLTTLKDEPMSSYSYINYLLLNNYENSFRLNSSTGLLSVAKPIDRETLVHSNVDAEIELKLIAIDTRSRMSSEGIVLVKIIDSNDNEPYFKSNSFLFHLNENQIYESNYTIGHVQAYDLDQADVLSYRLDYDTKHNFSVSFDGRIYVRSTMSFDREQQELYHLTVVVSDSKHVVAVPVRISINDLNDCDPKVIKVNNVQLVKGSNKFHLNMSTSQIKSIIDKKFPLIGLQVEDCDKGLNGQVQFRFNNDVLYNTFTVDHNQGLIKYDQKSTYLKDTLSKLSSIDVTVTDMSPISQLSSTYSVQFEMTNANLNRERTLLKENFIDLFISESRPLNESLYKFELIYPISEISIYAGDVYGHFTVFNHNLVLTRSLDFESTKLFELYLFASNYQKEYEEFQYVFVRVNVLNENDNAPLFLNEIYNASILEEEDPLFVTKVMAADLDSTNTKITYKLMHNDKVPFRIDPQTGDIWTVAKIDREVDPFFRLTVSAEDEGGLSSTCNIFVTIEDKNDNPPRFTRLFRVNITENTPIGSFVTQVTSIDKDQKGYANVTYNLLTKTKSFEIDRVTGNVYVSAQLDREERDEYLLTVSADDGSWKAQTTLTINILDENDVSPRFDKESYQFNIFIDNTDRIGSNVTIGQVRAIDLDEGTNGLVNYRLKSRSKYFVIDPHSGEIVLKRIPKIFSSLELNFLNDHLLTVIAFDKGLLPRASEVSVLVRCVNSQKSNGAVLSNTVSIVIPADLDNHTLLYTSNSLISLAYNQSECIVQSKYNQVFFTGFSQVQPNKNYLIKANNSFREMAINISVTEANSHAPVFVTEQNSTTLSENVYGVTLVDRFKATDQDESTSNNMIRYVLNFTTLHWNVNASSYILVNYRDKYPQLFKKNLTLSELVSNIGELSAVQSPFTIDQSNGELYLTHALDFELITRYSLLISASDNAWYSKVTSFGYEVFVGDIDDFDDYNPKSLRTDSMRPDPMSIGVILVVFFFIILILAISTSFLFYHNQKKNHLRDLSIPQRKLFLSSFSPYLPSNSQLPSQASRSSRLPSRPQIQVVSQASAQMARPQPTFINSPSMCPPMPQVTQSSSRPMHIGPNMVPSTLCKSQFRPELNMLNDRGHHLSVSQLPLKRPDIVTPSGHTSNNSVTNASESASIIASRMQMATAPSSIYTHTNSENYTDNYSNILASAEHYDLENASSIAPSDIDIVYHYKGFRNRDTLSVHQKHAPLSRLSPSVSELSSAPRILTLQDLSPQVPPCPPIMNRAHMRKQVNQMTMNSINGQDDDVAVTENSFNCSEFGENYDLCKKDKNVFQRVW